MAINTVIQEEINIFLTEEYVLNEGFDFKRIRSFVNSITDKQQYLKQIVDRLGRETQETIRYKLGAIAVSILMFWNPSINNPAEMVREIAQNKEVTMEQLLDMSKENDATTSVANAYVNPEHLTLSEKGKELIKKHEGLRLKGYSIGDGKVTIGYGHAEPAKRSRYKVGQEISKAEADKLFDRDIESKIKGIKRMFRQWGKRNKKEYKISQGMFDALVSIAYNTGITGLRNTQFAEKLERANDPMEVAELIKRTRLKRGFSGLQDRREDEYQRFVSPD